MVMPLPLAKIQQNEKFIHEKIPEIIEKLISQLGAIELDNFLDVVENAYEYVHIQIKSDVNYYIVAANYLVGKNSWMHDEDRMINSSLKYDKIRLLLKKDKVGVETIK